MRAAWTCLLILAAVFFVISAQALKTGKSVRAWCALTDVVISGSIAALLFVAQLEAFGFAVSGLVAGVSILLVPGFGVAMVGWGLWRKRPVFARRGVALVAGTMLAISASTIVVGAQTRESQSRGDRVCDALEAHRRATGSYPRALEELVPTFLVAIPPTCMGMLRSFRFHYTKVSDDEFRIWFESTMFIECARGPANGWRCDD